MFDPTFYEPLDESKDERGVRLGQVKPFNFKERNVVIKNTDMYEDFFIKVAQMEPDLIAASIVEDTYPIFFDDIFRAVITRSNSFNSVFFSRIDQYDFFCFQQFLHILLE